MFLFMTTFYQQTLICVTANTRKVTVTGTTFPSPKRQHRNHPHPLSLCMEPDLILTSVFSSSGSPSEHWPEQWLPQIQL